MVTWGVTDAEGDTASTGSRQDDAPADGVASHAVGRRQSVAGVPSETIDREDGPRRRGLPPITVEPTPAGLATALSHASAGLVTTGPPRSHPAYRREPPPITVGDRTRVPARVRAATPDVDVTLELPSTLSALFVAAPLSYYLPASVCVRDDATPRLFVDGRPRVELRDLETDAARLLRRVFHLDCLVRGGPSSVASTRTDGTRDDLLASLGLDAAALRSLSPERRLDTYLSAWDSSVDGRLPDWHLSTSVEPTPDAIPCLPALLGRLSLIDRPDGEPRERSALLDLTLSTAYRTRGRDGGANGSSGSRQARGASGSADVLAPTPPVSRFQGWLAPGRPVEAFKPTAAAFDHRRRQGGRPAAPTSIAVVLGDAHMADEPGQVAAVYRGGPGGDSPSVDVVRGPTRVALRETIQRGYDLLHYVGHCDDAGLRCADGHLAIADVTTCRVPAFFLNACGSYDAGLALVERGAVAGAVAAADVLDRHATRVGTAFARLLASGFSVQGALTLARRRILMGQDYAVVGDGTFAPWSDRRPPGVLSVEPVDPDESAGCADGDSDAFRVTYEMVTARTIGERHSAPFGDDDLLTGDIVTTTLSRQSLCDHLAARSLPVIYGDDLLWSGDLLERLEPDSDGG